MNVSKKYLSGICGWKKKPKKNQNDLIAWEKHQLIRALWNIKIRNASYSKIYWDLFWGNQWQLTKWFVKEKLLIGFKLSLTI